MDSMQASKAQASGTPGYIFSHGLTLEQPVLLGAKHRLGGVNWCRWDHLPSRYEMGVADLGTSLGLPSRTSGAFRHFLEALARVKLWLGGLLSYLLAFCGRLSGPKGRIRNNQQASGVSWNKDCNLTCVVEWLVPRQRSYACSHAVPRTNDLFMLGGDPPQRYTFPVRE